MNEKVLKTLEYNKIIDLLTEYATSESGRELCRKLKPMTDLEAIEDAQAKTRDALSRIFKKGSLSFSGLHNIGASLKRLEIGGTLGIEELLRIA